MDISASRDSKGNYQLEIGIVNFHLTEEVISGLNKVLDQRLNRDDALEEENLKRKLKAYKILANKMSLVDDLVIQRFARQVTPEQLITLVRMADGCDMYEKVLNNLSKQNRTQFEDDYMSINKITEHNACIYMEQIVPLIKQAAKEQKALHDNL